MWFKIMEIIVRKYIFMEHIIVYRTVTEKLPIKKSLNRSNYRKSILLICLFCTKSWPINSPLGPKCYQWHPIHLTWVWQGFHHQVPKGVSTSSQLKHCLWPQEHFRYFFKLIFPLKKISFILIKLNIFCSYSYF